MKVASIGGQAVMEGVMMKAPDRMAIAVRKEDGTIKLHSEPVAPVTHGWMKWPIVRGVVSFVQMFTMGMKTISLSTEMSGLAAEEPSEFEKKLAKATGKSANDIMMAVAIVIALALGIGLFFFLPSLVSSAIERFWPNPFAVSLIEGAVRLVLFLLYMISISYMKEIRRVLMYHGAEHKTIFCYENECELTPENAMRFERLHPRCGTSFLLIVMVISVLFFSMLTALGFTGTVWIRLGTRLLFLPLVAGLSYEALKLLARYDNAFTRALRYPGLQLQRLTTKEPTRDMLEVAIAAFEGAQGITSRYVTPIESPESSDPAIASSDPAVQPVG